MTPIASWILRNKSIRVLWQFFLILATYPLFCIGFLVPRNPSLWVFANTFGLKDNGAYLFRYIQRHHPAITPVWIASRKADCNHVGSSSCYYRYSLTGLWLQYRAGISFATTGLNDFARFTLANSKIIQLWHGIPIKRILLDSPETIPFARSLPFLHDFLTRILRKNLQRYSMIPASSTGVQQRLSTAFGLPKAAIPVTGYPRHDIILKHSKRIRKRILYAPTWREDIQTAITITQEICNRHFISKINALGYEFWISIHPLNNELKKRLAPIADIAQFVDEHDINIILAQSEILITDYSSIAIDFSLLKRKTLFFTPDIHSYLRNRGLYSEFKSIIQQQGISSSEELLTAIKSTDERLTLSPEPFFKYQDTDSRKRIVNTVKKQLPQSRSSFTA